MKEIKGVETKASPSWGRILGCPHLDIPSERKRAKATLLPSVLTSDGASPIWFPSAPLPRPRLGFLTRVGKSEADVRAGGQAGGRTAARLAEKRGKERKKKKGRRDEASAGETKADDERQMALPLTSNRY